MRYDPPPPKEPLSHFEEDVAVSAAAARTGLSVVRRPVLEIDENLLPSRYYRRIPDRREILRLLEMGVEIPGCSKTNRVEYVLWHREEKQGGKDNK